MSGINNLFVGADNADAFYIGGEECELIYLGTEIVYQKGDFVGLKMKAEVTMQKESGSTADLKIKSSEPWTLSVPTASTWLDCSQMSGDSGQTVVVLTTNEENQTGSARTATITATTANYSATCVVTQSALFYVAYIHKSTLENSTNYYIDTGIFPTTETKMRFVYMGKGLVSSSKFLGFSWGSEEDVYKGATDDSDYRYFGGADGRTYWDYNNSRLENENFNNHSDGVLYDVEIGNNYVKNNLNETMIVNGTAQTNPPEPNIPIMVNVSCIWLKLLQIWEGQTLVFDGHAAVENDTIGLYDSVSDTMLTNSAVTMAYEPYRDPVYVCKAVHEGGEGTITSAPYTNQDRGYGVKFYISDYGNLDEGKLVATLNVTDNYHSSPLYINEEGSITFSTYHDNCTKTITIKDNASRTLGDYGLTKTSDYLYVYPLDALGRITVTNLY